MGSPLLPVRTLRRVLLSVLAMALVANPHVRAQTTRARVELRDYQGPAQVAAGSTERYSLAVSVDPRGEQNPLTIAVELPSTGPERWPAEDVGVVDAEGRPIPVCRDGLEWHRFIVLVPPVETTYWVQVAEPDEDRTSPPLPPEAERAVTDAQTGLHVAICRWFGGRRAALSLRFDDSHPTHLSTVLPILREYGFKGTFMINPGGPDYLENEAGWQACAAQGDMEFANHTLHHRGAGSDEEAEREIGDASRHIWGLFPEKSRLLALNLGGGTKWTTTRPLRQYLDRYCLFHVAGSLGMDDVYGNRVAALREHLAGHIERGLWCRAHFHSVGDGLASTEENFRAAMDVVREHESALWIAGMGDIYKYQQERGASKLSLEQAGPDRLLVRLSVGTDAALYDQPLTLEVTLPAGTSPADLTIREEKSAPLPIQVSPDAGPAVARVDVAPIDGAYTVEWAARSEGPE